MKKRQNKPAGEFGDAASQATANQDRFLFGKVPKKFGPRRLLAAQAMGFRFFKLGEAERLQLNDTNFVYDGMFWDAVLCGYLCLCEDSELFRAVRTPDDMIGKIMKWAEEHNCNAGSNEFTEVMTHYNSVMEAIIKSAAKQDEEHPDHPSNQRSGNAEGESLPGE